MGVSVNYMDSHYLLHEAPHRFSSLVLHLAGGVGVGAEGEAGIVVAQHGGDGFDIDAILEGCRGERVAEVVEAEVFNSGGFEELLVDIHHRIRVVHFAGQG